MALAGCPSFENPFSRLLLLQRAPESLAAESRSRSCQGILTAPSQLSRLRLAESLGRERRRACSCDCSLRFGRALDSTRGRSAEDAATRRVPTDTVQATHGSACGKLVRHRPPPTNQRKSKEVSECKTLKSTRISSCAELALAATAIRSKLRENETAAVVRLSPGGVLSRTAW